MAGSSNLRQAASEYNLQFALQASTNCADLYYSRIDVILPTVRLIGSSTKNKDW